MQEAIEAWESEGGGLRQTAEERVAPSFVFARSGIFDTHHVFAGKCDVYHRHGKKRSPLELFIHGKARFDDNEWAGFRQAVDSSMNLAGVRSDTPSKSSFTGQENIPYSET